MVRARHLLLHAPFLLPSYSLLTISIHPENLPLWPFFLNFLSDASNVF